MRNAIIIGNWKMNKPPQTARALAKKLSRMKIPSGREVVVCPPFVCLHIVKEELKGTKIKLGAQNMHFEESGAFTGEVSAMMLRDSDVSHVLVGHSERRLFFGETNHDVNKKLKQALEYKLIPVFCFGETQQERQGHMTEKVIERQLREGLDGITKSNVLQIIFAYEPVWAISRGDPHHKSATPQDAEDMHRFIRKFMARLYDKETSKVIRIIYGGSAKPENIDELMAQPDIDGALPGNASLEAEKFARVVNFK